MREQDQPKPEPMSRRKALSLLGLVAAVGYAVPSILTVSEAEAGAVVVRKDRRRRSHPDWWYRRRHRTVRRRRTRRD